MGRYSDGGIARKDTEEEGINSSRNPEKKRPGSASSVSSTRLGMRNDKNKATLWQDYREY